MAVLILAKHDNAQPERRHRQGGHRRQGDGRRHPRPGGRARTPAPRRRGGREARRRQEGDPRRGRGLRPPPRRAADRRSCASLAGPYEHIVFPGTTCGKNVAPRLAALLDVMVISEITGVVAPRHLRAADLRRQRHPDRAVGRPEEGRHRARRQLRGGRRAGPRADRDRGRPRPTRASPPGSRTRWRPPTGRSCPARGSSSPAAAASARRRTSPSSRSSPTSSAPPSAPRARRSTRLRPERLAGRADRQGGGPRPLHRRRHLRRHPAPRRHEGLARSSSPSTRTRRPRSSRSPTTASSATSSRSSRSSRRSSGDLAGAVLEPSTRTAPPGRFLLLAQAGSLLRADRGPQTGVNLRFSLKARHSIVDRRGAFAHSRTHRWPRQKRPLSPSPPPIAPVCTRRVSVTLEGSCGSRGPRSSGSFRVRRFVGAARSRRSRADLMDLVHTRMKRDRESPLRGGLSRSPFARRLNSPARARLASTVKRPLKSGKPLSSRFSGHNESP